MSTQHFAYHLKPLDFKGDWILPLSILQISHPETAEIAIQKYKGREGLVNRIVYDPANSPHQFMGDKILTWTEVSFCSMIDPNLVFKKLKELGFIAKEEKRIAFKIPLEAFPAKTMVWLYQKIMQDPNFIPQDDCCTLEQAYNHVDTNVLPAKTVEYFENWQDHNRRPLFFAYMQHILCAVPIDVSSCETIEIS